MNFETSLCWWNSRILAAILLTFPPFICFKSVVKCNFDTRFGYKLLDALLSSSRACLTSSLSCYLWKCLLALTLFILFHPFWWLVMRAGSGSCGRVPSMSVHFMWSYISRETLVFCFQEKQHAIIRILLWIISTVVTATWKMPIRFTGILCPHKFFFVVPETAFKLQSESSSNPWGG